MRASLRCAIVAVVICSWLAISNHCAFAAVATRGLDCYSAPHDGEGTDAAACPFHSKPAKQKQQNAQAQCCKVLRAVVPAQSKSWARGDAYFSNVGIEESTLIACWSRPIAALFLDTGPPKACSFAELVLQRSLLAHAPPAVA